MGQSLYAKTKQTNILIKSTNVVLTNLLSALCQATIFYFAVKIDEEGHTRVDILILYLSTPCMFLGLFLFSFIYQQLLGQKLTTFFSKKHMKQLSMFVLKQALYFVIIGVACAGIVHGIFVLWDVLRFLYNNSAPEEVCAACAQASDNEMQYPSFNIRNAYDFASTMCSFLLSMGSMFALYVATSEAKLTSLMQIYGNQEKSAFQKSISTFAAHISTFTTINRYILLSNLILFMMVTTQYLADLISLASMIWTQDNIIGNIIFFCLIVGYLVLLGI